MIYIYFYFKQYRIIPAEQSAASSEQCGDWENIISGVTISLSPCLATVYRLGSTKLNFTCLSSPPPPPASPRYHVLSAAMSGYSLGDVVYPHHPPSSSPHYFCLENLVKTRRKEERSDPVALTRSSGMSGQRVAGVCVG